jgi:hypothetical protein
LFQTQIYLTKKYLHRLLVLNPLTNTEIIGKVRYYKVSLNEKKDINQNINTQENIEIKVDIEPDNQSIGDLSKNETISPDKESPHNVIEMSKQLSYQNSLRSKKQSLKAWQETNLENPGCKRTVYHAHFFATDIDFLEKSEIRAFFLQNALTVEEAQLFQMKDYQHLRQQESENSNFFSRNKVVLLVTVLTLIFLACGTAVLVVRW